MKSSFFLPLLCLPRSFLPRSFIPRSFRPVARQLLPLTLASLLVVTTPAQAAETPPPGNYSAVMNWYLEQAETGKADAAYLLALQYQAGVRDGGEEQYLSWLEEAATRGHPEAAFRLATELWPNDGDPSNDEQARDLFATAAGGGLAEAAFNLGAMAEQGAGGPVDLEIAKAAYKKAARGGISASFLRLAAVSQAADPTAEAEIVSWLMLAAAAGDATAAGYLTDVSADLEYAVIEAARAKANAWD